MPWKMDGDKIAIESGNPVWVYDDGKEATIDGGHVTQKIADLTSEAATNRRKLREAQTALEGFDGLDAAAARKAIATVKNLDDKKLIDAGEVEKVKSEIEKAWSEKYTALETRFKATEGDLYSEKVGGAFAKSEIVQKKLIVPMDMVQDKFGKHFKVEDGKVVAYDESGNKIYSRERPGELAGFDEALSTLIDRYPHKDRILLDSGKSGGGASGGGAGGGGAKTITRAQYDQMGSAAQREHIKGGGIVTD